MADSMNDYLERDMQCEGLLECIYGLRPLDIEIFLLLAEHSEPLTVDEIGERIDRERSTAYRSVQRLIDSGFVQKKQINYEDGGYYHVFRLTDSEEITDEMQRTLNDWYAKVGQLIEEFREEYSQPGERTIEAEN
jgi:predicted transcriptional regulator